MTHGADLGLRPGKADRPRCQAGGVRGGGRIQPDLAYLVHTALRAPAGVR